MKKKLAQLKELLDFWLPIVALLFIYHIVLPVTRLWCKVFGHGKWLTDEIHPAQYCSRCFIEKESNV